MRVSIRLWAAAELAALFILWFVAVWSISLFRNASYWAPGAVLSSILIVFVSLVIRRPGWAASGFRFDNFRLACSPVGLATLCAVVLIAAVGAVVAAVREAPLQSIFHPISRESVWLKQVINFLSRGITQEAFFLGYLFHRWETVFGDSKKAVIANTFSFSFIHLPNSFLVAMTAVGGLFFGLLFLRVRNVFAIGLAHGVIALCVLSVFQQGGVFDSMRIGPPQLAPLAGTIANHLKPGDRVGMGSHSLVPAQFGDSFGQTIEKIVGKWDIDSDRLNQERLGQFFAGDQRVFCAITESDFNRYFVPSLRKRLYILDEQYIWKRRISFASFSFRDPLAAFRDHVLLVSNRSS